MKSNRGSSLLVVFFLLTARDRFGPDNDLDD